MPGTYRGIELMNLFVLIIPSLISVGHRSSAVPVAFEFRTVIYEIHGIRERKENTTPLLPQINHLSAVIKPPLFANVSDGKREPGP